MHHSILGSTEKKRRKLGGAQEYSSSLKIRATKRGGEGKGRPRVRKKRLQGELYSKGEIDYGTATEGRFQRRRVQRAGGSRKTSKGWHDKGSSSLRDKQRVIGWLDWKAVRESEVGPAAIQGGKSAPGKHGIPST